MTPRVPSRPDAWSNRRSAGAPGRGFRFGRREWRQQLERLDGRRTYFADEYAALVLPAVEALPHRTWEEATSAREDPASQVLVIRHDIDQDIENAVRMARWEAERGVRATYCVLHTAWYYARRNDRGRISRRSEYMVEACLEIQDLGHEINFHNNAVSYALRTGANPYRALRRELVYLRSRGLRITGVSSHGDPLCHRRGFINKEMFAECRPAVAGRRAVRHKGRRVQLGKRTLAEFGLTYDGGDLPRDVYISDSGGRLKVVRDTGGRGGVRRADWPGQLPYRHITGILAHPAWWDLRRTSRARGRSATGLRLL